MPSIEERVAYLEGTVGEHSRAFTDIQHALSDIRTGLTELRADMNARFNQVDQRFVQIDQRFAQVDQRLIWLTGTQFAVLLAIIATLAAAYYR
ncbi:MAG: hypothetical protein A3F70_00605 [Acidobacteria bacterium RIFCSPLOWO2_12_FULL_67_14]|nr:MAG: hypothetical protein A3F70_00605 [Acidobacteria bacterium RIFCSPLOWO2_12_FULL_67_14]